MSADGQHARTQVFVKENRGFAAKIHAVICTCIVLGMLAVGLAPFQSPRNGASWLRGGNGIRLQWNSTVLSDGTFETAESDPASSLEIWFEPDAVNSSGPLLTVSNLEGHVQFEIQQFYSNLILHAQTYQGERTAGVEHLLTSTKRFFVTVTSGSEGSAMYLDGTLVRRFPGLSFDRMLAGQLIIGTLPTGHGSWRGKVFGLAIYRSELTAEQVYRQYHTWTEQQRPDVSDSKGLVALYLLNEGAGNVVHNAVRTGFNLSIPERYTVVHRWFLEPFWSEFKPTRSYCKDVLINIVGFIPLGFVFYAYWKHVWPINRAVLATMAVGLAVSLTIEILQYYLPTRNSGTTDLFTNTLGTYLGVRFCRMAKEMWQKVYAETTIRPIEFLGRVVR